jgi:uncharacterized membrane protein YcgQ (UPF0703/DUF1980 family)
MRNASKRVAARAIALAVLCFVLALGGCQGKETVDQDAANTNENGTSAVDSGDGRGGQEVPLADADDEAADVVEIKEKMFVAQTNDIYFNADDYVGKTIKYEGLFDIYVSPGNGQTYYSVIRYGPGCCGVDANAGFEVVWDGEYPKQNDWVEAVGVLEKYAEGDVKFLRVALTSLKVLPTRGAENVSQ